MKFKNNILAISILLTSITSAEYLLKQNIHSGIEFSAPAASYQFSSHTFTNCGKTGYQGPTLSNCTGSYSSASWISNDNFSVESGIQVWTVPETGTYKITATGAQGASNTTRGGYGAIISSEFSFSEGDKIKLLVGQQGSVSTSYIQTGSYGGGGGASYVATYSDQPLLVAAGGHGVNNGYYGLPASTSSDYGNGNGLTSGNSKGGCSGGFYSNGSCSAHNGDGQGFVNGGAGGVGAYGASGGFGGGSGTRYNGSGSGGGYTGGSGSDAPQSANDAGVAVAARSFSNGNNTSGITHSTSLHGSILIEKL